VAGLNAMAGPGRVGLPADAGRLRRPHPAAVDPLRQRWLPARRRPTGAAAPGRDRRGAQASAPAGPVAA